MNMEIHKGGMKMNDDHIERLNLLKIIKRVGPDKDGHWEVIK
jgi:hypothetical protein